LIFPVNDQTLEDEYLLYLAATVYRYIAPPGLLPDSPARTTNASPAIRHFANTLRVYEPASSSGMSTSAFHHHFRAMRRLGGGKDAENESDPSTRHLPDAPHESERVRWTRYTLPLSGQGAYEAADHATSSTLCPTNTPQGGISTFTKFIHKKQEMNF
jgi:hypothetical protein